MPDLVASILSPSSQKPIKTTPHALTTQSIHQQLPPPSPNPLSLLQSPCTRNNTPVSTFADARMSPQSMASSGFQFGIRKQEHSGGSSSSPAAAGLRVSRDSHRIRKPPLPLPPVQYRPPVIIHTYSPKVIHTVPDDFMSLVQKLTGSSDTRLRLKKSPTAKKEKKAAPADGSKSLERQGSGSSTNCGSPTVSEDSSFVVGKEGKQSNSPRSPLDSHFEFDNVSESMFPHFDAAFSQQQQQLQVKVEPMFAFHDTTTNFQNQFSFFADHLLMQQPRPHVAPLPPPQVEQMMANPGYPLMNPSLPDLSPTAAWSQSFLDCLGAPAPTPYQFQRQRFAGYVPPTPESSTMVALENIHAFLST